MKNAMPPPKKQKAANPSIEQNTEEAADQADPQAWESYSLSIFRSLFRKFSHTSCVAVDENNTDQTPPPRGDETRGWRHHSQHGMYPHIRHWAEGSPFRVAFMLAELAQHFKVVDLVAERLGLKLSKEAVAQAKVDSYTIGRVRSALHQLKQCRSEAEQTDYSVVLAATAPERDVAKSHPGVSIEKVFDSLGVQSGSRYVKATGERRPRAPDQAITRRTTYDRSLLSRELQPGDAATSRGRPCTVLAIDHEADTCTLGFKVGNVELTRNYTCIYKGNGVRGPLGGRSEPFPKGSARLCRVPPSLRREPRAIRKDEKAEAARPKVEELFNAEGARSPAQRDQVRRRLGVGLYETVTRARRRGGYTHSIRLSFGCCMWRWCWCHRWVVCRWQMCGLHGVQHKGRGG